MFHKIVYVVETQLPCGGIYNNYIIQIVCKVC